MVLDFKKLIELRVSSNQINKNDMIDESIKKSLFKGRDNFVDPSTVIKNRKDGTKRKFYTTNIDASYTNDDICNIFNKIDAFFFKGVTSILLT